MENLVTVQIIEDFQGYRIIEAQVTKEQAKEIEEDMYLVFDYDYDETQFEVTEGDLVKFEIK